MQSGRARRMTVWAVLAGAFAAPAGIEAKEERSQTMGPLRVHPSNGRWFARPDGNAVWLTGSHTWANRQERGVEGQTPDFDYEGYLAFLEKHGHNFIRLWAWEHARWMQFVPKSTPVRYKPLPYARTGPGKARDGQPKFDLTRFDADYFQRLRRRVVAARRRGIYVAVMLFQGFSLDKTGGRKGVGNAWRGHPFHADNNVNGLDGNPSGDGTGNEVHTLKVPRVTRLQEAYVRKVIETVGDLDHVLWEISNESHRGSVRWQYHMIGWIRKVEAARAMQHPVGMTGAPIGAKDLRAGPADWISPPGKKYLTDPPPADGRKVVIVDSDHCDPWGHDPVWPWKVLLRGGHFLLMDGYVDFRLHSPARPDPRWDPTRRAMGSARRLAERLDLAALTPRGALASSGYCLAQPGRCYVAMLPAGGGRKLTVELAAGRYTLQWVEPVGGRITAGPAVLSKGGKTALTSPLDPPAVAVLRAAR